MEENNEIIEQSVMAEVQGEARLYQFHCYKLLHKWPSKWLLSFNKWLIHCQLKLKHKPIPHKGSVK